ncbi:MAG: C25 family cysteine peptidase [Lentimicrobiaceae bacterium]|nr:C25 family cysteine peptidase [Lentimicrobiaceae bacterium]
MKLKKTFIALLLLIGFVPSYAQRWVDLGAAQPAEVTTTLISGSETHSVISVQVPGFNLIPLQTPRGEAFSIQVDGTTPLLEKGMPDLPKVTTSLLIPDQANMEVRIISSSYVDFPFLDIAPSKGNFTRDIDPATVAYTYSNAYSRDAFFPETQAWLRQPYIFRDYRGQALVINPFVYNPVTRILRVYYQMELEVYANGISTINVRSHSSASHETIDAEFSKAYARHFLNYNHSSRYTPLEEQGKMLIISHGPFMETMEDFVAWKKTIGIPVEMVDVSTIGTNSTAIKAFVADYYATNGLTFLLLVGDHAQVPTITSGNLGGPSDPAYGYLEGNDHYAEVFVGRFSAENVAQVETQVVRSIEYEKYPDITNDWFSKGFGIASSEGTGDDGEYDWEHMRNIRTDLMDFTYTAVGELYDGSRGGEDQPGNPTSSMVSTEVNAGRSIINYTGHGSQTSWGTTGFSNSGINGLTNNHMWPFIISVACVNGDFLNGTCFAEAWLRAKNDNGPTGAVATFMSTINQSWNPPMRGQDEMVDILCELKEGNIKRTFGGIAVNGCLGMNDAYGSAGSDMTDTWLIFGDPSLMVRTAAPSNLVVNHSPVAFIGSDVFEVNGGVDGAFACLTLNGEILGTATINNGSAIISIPTLTDIGNMQLAVTAFNHMPYLTDIDIMPLEGPYVVYGNQTINDAACNNNGQLDYGESVLMAIGLKNVGTEDISNVMVTLSSTDPYLTLGDTSEMYPLIEAGQTTEIADAFSISVSSDVPDKYRAMVSYTAVSDDHTWSGNFELMAHSVSLLYSGVSISDEEGNNNGKADAGETFKLHLSIINAGTAPAYNVTGIISSEDPFIYINVDSINYGSLDGYEMQTAEFTVTALPTTPPGHQANFSFEMFSDSGFFATSNFSIVVGQIPVLIIDLDKNHNSGPVIKQSLTNLDISSNYITSWPLVLGSYQSIFVCLGVYPNNAVLTNSQGQALANFLNNGGKLYMEGGDTWVFNTPTPVHPMFNIEGLDDGSNDLQVLSGIDSTMTSGLSFSYNGDNRYIDRLAPIGNAVSLFRNSMPEYISTIAFDGDVYKTIGSSFEFSGLKNGEGRSVKDSLMAIYVNFFDLCNHAPLLANFVASEIRVCENEEITFTDFSAGAVISWQWSFPGGTPDTSNEQNPVVSYRIPGTYDVTLTVSDDQQQSTTVKSGYITVDYCMNTEFKSRENINVYPNPSNNSFTTDIQGLTGKVSLTVYDYTGKLCQSKEVNAPTIVSLDMSSYNQGIYILKIQNNDEIQTIKLILTK